MEAPTAVRLLPGFVLGCIPPYSGHRIRGVNLVDSAPRVSFAAPLSEGLARRCWLFVPQRAAFLAPLGTLPLPGQIGPDALESGVAYRPTSLTRAALTVV